MGGTLFSSLLRGGTAAVRAAQADGSKGPFHSCSEGSRCEQACPQQISSRAQSIQQLLCPPCLPPVQTAGSAVAESAPAIQAAVRCLEDRKEASFTSFPVPQSTARRFPYECIVNVC